MDVGSRVAVTCPGPFRCVVGTIAKAVPEGFWVQVAAEDWPTETPRVFVDAERADWMFFHDFELDAGDEPALQV